jgi:hypothetical protein
MGAIEQKVLGALLFLSGGRREFSVTRKKIVRKMGYVRDGGAISFALRLLEMNNYIARPSKDKYIILV